LDLLPYSVQNRYKRNVCTQTYAAIGNLSSLPVACSPTTSVSPKVAAASGLRNTGHTCLENTTRFVSNGFSLAGDIASPDALDRHLGLALPHCGAEICISNQTLHLFSFFGAVGHRDYVAPHGTARHCRTIGRSVRDSPNRKLSMHVDLIWTSYHPKIAPSLLSRAQPHSFRAIIALVPRGVLLLPTASTIRRSPLHFCTDRNQK
jgi:hypothetical protein